MTVTINKKAPVTERFKIFLHLASTFFNFTLTDKEIAVMNEFFWVSQGVIDTDSRKAVAHALSMSEFNLNNYLLKLRKKNVINEDGIKPELMVNIAPSEKSFGIVFLIES